MQVVFPSFAEAACRAPPAAVSARVGSTLFPHLELLQFDHPGDVTAWQRLPESQRALAPCQVIAEVYVRSGSIQ